jgi:hypothetical protein
MVDDNGPDLIGGSGDGAEIGAVLCLGGGERAHCIMKAASSVLIFG